MSGITVLGTEYSPGSWVCFGGERMWLLADLDLTDPVVGVAWDLVRRGAGLEAVLGAITGAREGSGHNYAVARLHGTGAEVMVRGTGWADISTVDTSGAPAELLRAKPGENSARTVDHFHALRLHSADTATDFLLPLGAAVVSASLVAVYADEGQPETVADPDSQQSTRLFAGMLNTSLPDVVERQLPPEPETWAPAPPPSAPPRAPSAVTLPPEHTGYPSPAGPSAPAAPGSVFAPSFPAEPPTTYVPPPRRGAPDSTVSADGVITAVPWAAIDATAVDEPPPAYRPPPSASFHAPVAPPAVPVPPAPAYPASLSNSYHSPPAAPALSPTGDEHMHTVPRTSGAGVASGPMVETTRCGLGHANPPHARSCRICKEPVPQQEPTWAARPPLGVLRLSTGDEVLLDRGVILGRAPGAPEGSGRDEPNRYKLPSSDGSMSRKHCEVVLDGWSVYVVDLKSMNGTAVTPPGGPPEWLVPEVPRPIEDGWTVNLDPTTWFRYEVTE